MFEKYEKELLRLNEISQNREIKDIKKEGKFILYNGKKLLNLSSNDYLGIAENFEIINDFKKNSNYSFGSASARLLTGTSPVYNELEDLLCRMYKKESALLFNSGYHANVGIMSSLAGKNDIIFSDKLNHASIIDGMKLSGSTFYRFKHNDYEHLEQLLQNHRNHYENAIIITESVFSMDGDSANLEKLSELKKKYKTLLIVDEAHAFGVFGSHALGLCEEKNVLEDIDLLIATFGKSIGSMGAFCVGKKILINYLKNKARSFIFSTSIPEINVAFSIFVLKNILPETAIIRKKLLLNSQKLRNEIEKSGLNTLGESHIIPIIIGTNEATISTCKLLQNNKFFVLPIRHPTVPLNTSRIRISMRADIGYEDTKNIPQLIKKYN